MSARGNRSGGGSLAGQRRPRRHQGGRGAFEHDPPAVVARARPEVARGAEQIAGALWIVKRLALDLHSVPHREVVDGSRLGRRRHREISSPRQAPTVPGTEAAKAMARSQYHRTRYSEASSPVNGAIRHQRSTRRTVLGPSSQAEAGNRSRVKSPAARSSSARTMNGPTTSLGETCPDNE